MTIVPLLCMPFTPLLYTVSPPSRAGLEVSIGKNGPRSPSSRFHDCCCAHGKGVSTLEGLSTVILTH